MTFDDKETQRGGVSKPALLFLLLFSPPRCPPLENNPLPPQHV